MDEFMIQYFAKKLIEAVPNAAISATVMIQRKKQRITQGRASVITAVKSCSWLGICSGTSLGP